MTRRTLVTLVTIAALTLLGANRFPEDTPDTPANRALDRSFAAETERVAATGGLADVRDAADWKTKAPEYRRQLAEMLGLDPPPDRGPLEATKTGEVRGDGFVVENLHFQSLPGLFVTANLYRPATASGRLPAILYLCGHSPKVVDGVSIGNKTSYGRHGAWFARHGYVCLILDTVEMGEIRGEHHGTFSKGRWWWWSRGYTPAGVEAWNAIRGLDYLESRPDVDATRMGVTGRSGGGATSWWVAALDERVRAAAPTAGITDLQDHVVGGCIEGHCDCMYFTNTYRWDFSRVAALVAPRPLLICNTDKDPIFPIDGVWRLYRDVRRLYELLGAADNLGIQFAEGPHQDLQPLHVGAFHWFERHLKGADPMQVIDEGADESPTPESLRVFATLPSPERNTVIDRSFVPPAPVPKLPDDAGAWRRLRAGWIESLRRRTFAGWPDAAAPAAPRPAGALVRDGIRMTAFDFETEPCSSLRMYFVRPEEAPPAHLDRVILDVLDEAGWKRFCGAYGARFGPLLGGESGGDAADGAFARARRAITSEEPVVVVCPRGVGPTAWSGSEKSRVHRLRRYHLLGQTLDGMRVWDIRRAVQAVRGVQELAAAPMWIRASGDLAADAIYAALFEPGVAGLDLRALPATHAGDTAATTGPALLNVLRTLDLPQAVAAAAEETRVVIATDDTAPWAWAATTLARVGLADRLTIVPPADDADE